MSEIATASREELLRSLQDLASKQAEIEAALRQRLRDDVRALRAETMQKCAALGISIEELVSGSVSSSRPAPAKPKSEDKRGYVSPKYRDPVSGQTWTGRGGDPKWMVAHGLPPKKLDATGKEVEYPEREAVKNKFLMTQAEKDAHFQQHLAAG